MKTKELGVLQHRFMCLIFSFCTAGDDPHRQGPWYNNYNNLLHILKLDLTLKEMINDERR